MIVLGWLNADVPQLKKSLKQSANKVKLINQFQLIFQMKSLKTVFHQNIS